MSRPLNTYQSEMVEYMTVGLPVWCVKQLRQQRSITGLSIAELIYRALQCRAEMELKEK